METLQIVKIGGKIVNDEDKLEEFLQQFVAVDQPKILVHGGGSSASDLCRKLDIPVRMNEGRRITDQPTLDVAVMVYAGLINKKIVAGLQGRSCHALGLTGADLNTIPARKRTGTEINYGFVGDIDSGEVNTHFISRLLDEQIVPVFPAITHDNNGQLLNTNADTIASGLAVALSDKYRVVLSYCFEKAGVMLDATDDESLIEKLDRNSFEELKENGSITEGMVPKLHTAFEALSRNVHRVNIKKAANLSSQTGTELIL